MTTKKKTKATVKKTLKSKEAAKAGATKNIAKRAVRATKPKSKAEDKSIAKLIAKVDVGWGNTLYARGEGAGLDWSKGVPLENTGDDTWVFDASQETEDVVLKLLINDQEWSDGENVNLSKGKTVIVKPKFSGA